MSNLSAPKILGAPTAKASEFIFNEAEFETELFQPAAFVAKYRRVTSLESLRDQLRNYGGNLKEQVNYTFHFCEVLVDYCSQLYEIINRDYKDFIAIATKVSQ
jgi:hypothetical protein